MKQLSGLLYKSGIEEILGSMDIDIRNVCFDSKKAGDETLFVAVRGTRVDGHDYIDETIGKGAVAIVCEKVPAKIHKGITYVKVKDSSASLGFIASNFYGNPSSDLKLIGITGTNGKTTTATLLYDLFISQGFKAGLLSTVSNKINGKEIPSTHTTPDAIHLNMLLQNMVDEKCEYCFMEVSSHSIIQNRISGLQFAGGVFTNLTHEHLDYHKSFKDYAQAKKQFFDRLGSDAFALSNKDDKNGKYMLQNTAALKKMYSIRYMADFKCKIIENQFSGSLLNINGIEIWTKLIGDFNAYNLLATYGTAVLLGQDPVSVLIKLSGLNPVEGRFDCIQSGGVLGIVDYAHTPDALQNILSTINTIRTGNEMLITVVGCGGDRDVQKRPMMARIACEKSDRVILTSDNPRSESPEAIIESMQKGVASVYSKKVLSIVDRKEAIKTACALAKRADIILVAGKGHEKYQEVMGVKYPFDDKKVLIDACKMIRSN